MKKFVVLETGAKAQIVLNAREWELVYTSFLSKFDFRYELVSFELQLDKNHERTVLSNDCCRRNLPSMYEAMKPNNMTSEDVFKLSSVYLFFCLCLTSRANFAFNFVENEHDMHVYGEGVYLFGDLFQLKNFVSAQQMKRKVGTYQLPCGAYVTNYRCTKNKTIELNNGNTFISESGFVGVVRRDYVAEDYAKFNQALSDGLIALVSQTERFRAVAFLSPLDTDSVCYSFGAVSFDVPQTKRKNKSCL